MSSYALTARGERLMETLSSAHIELQESTQRRVRWYVEKLIAMHGEHESSWMFREVCARTRRAKSPIKFLRWALAQESESWLLKRRKGRIPDFLLRSLHGTVEPLFGAP